MEMGLHLRIGCCGFVAAQAQYFRLFKVIEIQQTFYQLPWLETAAKWRSAAPEDFEFTLKAWQVITHEPSSPTYRSESQHGEIQYFRLHGIAGYQYRYTDGDLEHLRGWVEGKPTYVLFNNNGMKEDALRFLEMTRGGTRGAR
jgi:uncharacterized protein YecE (DUF72 family)